MNDPIRNGQRRATRMRRIGSRHMIVMPMQTAQVLSIEDVKKTLHVARQQEAATLAQLDRHRKFIEDLELQVRTFEALPIERDDDDPAVPQEPAQLPGASRRRPAAATHELAPLAPEPEDPNPGA